MARMRHLLVALLLAVGVSCAEELPEHIALQAAAENVEIAPDAPNSNAYKLLGEVTGVAASPDPEIAEQAAKNDLRNKAAALGASIVTVDEDVGGKMLLQDKTKVRVVGRAYKSVD
jgi:hypothetical protein